MNSLNSSGLVLQDVSKTFRRGRKKTPVLHGVNLRVVPGEFTTIMGASGAGKTTLIRLIAGLETVDSGTVLFNGEPLKPGDIGYIFQKPVLYPQHTVKENILFGTRLKAFPQPADMGHIDQLVQLLGLEGLLERRPQELSGGQQQRVGIARALARKSPLVLFDEPLASVDESMSKSIRAEIRKLHEELGFTALFITHKLEEALALGQKMLVMVGGTIAQYDTPERILNQPASLEVADLCGLPVSNRILCGSAAGESESHVVFRASEVELGKSKYNVAPVLISQVSLDGRGTVLEARVQSATPWIASDGRSFLLPPGQIITFYGSAGVGAKEWISIDSEHCRVVPSVGKKIK